MWRVGITALLLSLIYVDRLMLILIKFGDKLLDPHLTIFCCLCCACTVTTREYSKITTTLKANLIPELSGLHSRQSRSRVEAKLQRLRKRREKLETAAGLSIPQHGRRRVKTKKPVFR